jgi:hypothetical protein
VRPTYLLTEQLLVTHSRADGKPTPAFFTVVAKPPEPLATMLPLVLRASRNAFCAAQAHSLRPAEAGGGFMRTSARTLCWTRTVIFLTAFGSNISLMGLLEAGHVVLRHALRILGVLRLGARVAGVRITVRVEGRTGGSAGVARRDAPRLSGANGLIGLTLHLSYRVDIGGQTQTGRGYDQGNAKHHRYDKMFHGVLPKHRF